MKGAADSPFILAAGLVSKVLAYDLYKAGRRALDLGHLENSYDYYYRNKALEGFYTD